MGDKNKKLSSRPEGEAVACKGADCSATDGIGHSQACLAENAVTIDAGRLDTPGNRHPEYRYLGYKGQPLCEATKDQELAYLEGVSARSISAPPAAAEGVPADSVALAACRAVVEWCDKNPPAGSALWCVNLCRFAIAKAPAFSPVAASEPSLAMVGAQAGAVPAREYTDGRWHHGNGYLCMGTLRVARADFDTNPPEEFQTAFFEEMCAVLNTKTTAAPPVDANKGGVPEGYVTEVEYRRVVELCREAEGRRYCCCGDCPEAPSAPVAADESAQHYSDLSKGLEYVSSLPTLLLATGDKNPELRAEIEDWCIRVDAALTARKAAGKGGRDE